ncbi:oncostatin-M [Petaurus breviceps papuanus]|uniref:oncostatin-M n=1 Tax=Petaurus breviceps papuanus TaxID=3040969 RepID=UPI0036DEA41C
MWAWLRLSSLLGLICGLLWLCPVARSTCPKYQKLLYQLKNMAKKDFLKSFMTDQGLDLPHSPDICKESSDIPKTETLKNLPPVTFLQNVSQTLYQIEQELEKTIFSLLIINIQGFNNNVCCMLQTLPNAPAACPAPRSHRTLSPTPAARSFSWKLERCKTISSYQRFMENVGEVLETWGPSPGQRKRNKRSLLKGLLGQRRKVRAG